MSKTLCKSHYVKQSASLMLIRVLRTLWRKTSLAQVAHYHWYSPNKFKSIIVIIFHGMFMFTVGTFDLGHMFGWSLVAGGGGAAVGETESTERVIECFLKKCGSWKILAQSQNLGSVVIGLEVWFSGDLASRGLKFFSTSRFTNTKNGKSWHHENKVFPTPFKGLVKKLGW